MDPQTIPTDTAQPSSETDASINSTKEQIMDYDSNPFTLSFKAFGLMVDYAKGVFIALLVFGLLGFISNIFSFIPNPFAETTSSGSVETASTSIDAGVVIFIALVVLGLIVIGFFVGVLFSAAYKGFVAAGSLSAINKQTITFGEAFNAMTQRFGALFKAELVTTLKIIGGYLLFIVPGVRAQLRYQSTPYFLMANQQMSASEGMTKSRELYKNHLMEVFGILTVGSLIPVIGQAISASGLALSTVQISAYAENNMPTPKTHILNYLGFIFAGFIVFIFILLIGAVLLVAS